MWDRYADNGKQWEVPWSVFLHKVTTFDNGNADGNKVGKHNRHFWKYLLSWKLSEYLQTLLELFAFVKILQIFADSFWNICSRENCWNFCRQFCKIFVLVKVVQIFADSFGNNCSHENCRNIYRQFWKSICSRENCPSGHQHYLERVWKWCEQRQFSCQS